MADCRVSLYRPPLQRTRNRSRKLSGRWTCSLRPLKHKSSCRPTLPPARWLVHCGGHLSVTWPALFTAAPVSSHDRAHCLTVLSAAASVCVINHSATPTLCNFHVATKKGPDANFRCVRCALASQSVSRPCGLAP